MSKPYWAPSEFPFNTCFLLVHRPKILVSTCYFVSWFLQCPFSWPCNRGLPLSGMMQFSVLPLCVVLIASPCWHCTWAIYFSFWIPTWAFLSLLMPFLWCIGVNTSLHHHLLVTFFKTTPCSLHTSLMLGGGFLRASPALCIMSSDPSANKDVTAGGMPVVRAYWLLVMINDIASSFHFCFHLSLSLCCPLSLGRRDGLFYRLFLRDSW